MSVTTFTRRSRTIGDATELAAFTPFGTYRLTIPHRDDYRATIRQARQFAYRTPAYPAYVGSHDTRAIVTAERVDKRFADAGWIRD